VRELPGHDRITKSQMSSTFDFASIMTMIRLDLLKPDSQTVIQNSLLHSFGRE
jgi:hypothetical protein